MDAISSFQNALKGGDFYDVRAWEGLAQAYYAQGRFMAALKINARIRELDSANPAALFNAAEINQRLGHYEESVLGFDSLLQHPVYALMAGCGAIKSRYSWARELYKAGIYGLASENCLAALSLIRAEMVQEFPMLYKLCGDILLLLNRISPSSPASSFSLSNGIFKVGNTLCEKALRCYQRADYDDPQNRAHDFSLAYWYDYLETKRESLLKAAIYWSLRAVHSDKRIAGVILLPLSPILAKRLLWNALILNPKDSLTWTLVGYARLYTVKTAGKDDEVAKKAFSLAFENDPDNKAAMIGQALTLSTSFDNALSTDLGYLTEFSVAHVLSYLQKQSKAQAQEDVSLWTLQKYLERRPLDSMAWLVLGLGWERQGFYDRARDCLVRAVEAESNDLVCLAAKSALVRVLLCLNNEVEEKGEGEEGWVKVCLLLKQKRYEECLLALELLSPPLEQLIAVLWSFPTEQHRQLCLDQLVGWIDKTEVLTTALITRLILVSLALGLDPTDQQWWGRLTKEHLQALPASLLLLLDDPAAAKQSLLRRCFITPSNPTSWQQLAQLYADFEAPEQGLLSRIAYNLSEDAQSKAKCLAISLANDLQKNDLVRAIWLAPSVFFSGPSSQPPASSSKE